MRKPKADTPVVTLRKAAAAWAAGLRDPITDAEFARLDRQLQQAALAFAKSAPVAPTQVAPTEQATWKLSVAYPLTLPYETQLTTLLGRAQASGAGFGDRDLTFYYRTKADAEAARDLVHALKLEALAWYLDEVEDP